MSTDKRKNCFCPPGSFSGSKESLVISTVVDVDGKEALLHWSEVCF